MATKLTNSLQREIRIPGVDAPVVLTLSEGVVSAHVKGSRHKVFCSFETLVGAMRTFSDVPSFLFGKPLELLKHEGAKKSTKKKQLDTQPK